MREQRIIVICLATAALITIAWLVTRAETVDSSSAAGSQAHSIQSTPVSNTVAQTEALDTAQLVQKIRRHVGSPLDGSVFEGVSSDFQTAPPLSAALRDAPPPAEFDEIYAEVARSAACSTNAPWFESQPPRVAPPGDAPLSDPQQRFHQSLRDAARQLESAAAELENDSAFADADRLRRWAHRLRADARYSTSRSD